MKGACSLFHNDYSALYTQLPGRLPPVDRHGARACRVQGGHHENVGCRQTLYLSFRLAFCQRPGHRPDYPRQSRHDAHHDPALHAGGHLRPHAGHHDLCLQPDLPAAPAHPAAAQAGHRGAFADPGRAHLQCVHRHLDAPHRCAGHGRLCLADRHVCRGQRRAGRGHQPGDHEQRHRHPR